jgi:hypothetical protein
MIRHYVLAALAVLLVACNSSGSSSESAQETVGGASVSSYAQAPLTKETSSLALDWGSKAQPNQFAIADVITYGGPKITITAPAGWTLIRDDSSPATRQSFYWHTVAANDPSTETWSFSEPVDAQGAVLLLNNVDPASPIDMSSGNTGTGGTMSAKPISTTGDADMILSFYATDFHLPGLQGSSPQMPANTRTVVNHEASPEFWILATYQNHNGVTEEQVCSAAQIFNWTAAQVAIKHGRD